jgi:hypothetical protein
MANINTRIPEEGEKIKKLVEIAQERNFDYKPSNEALVALRDYCDRIDKSKPDIFEKCKEKNLIPQFAKNPSNLTDGFLRNYEDEV